MAAACSKRVVIKTMKYFIDSNIFIYAAAGKPEAVDILSEAVAGLWSGYSIITRIEVFGYKSFEINEEMKLTRMLSCFHECEVTGLIVDKAIELRKSDSIKIPGAIIAASAIIQDATLITRNETDFNAVGNLKILNPFAN